MTIMQSVHHDPRGSLWHRWDLHFYTPSSIDDYENNSVTNQQIVDKLIQVGIRVVAITDHLTIDTARIHELQKMGGDSLTVLPGIELRDEHGGDPIHYICIFPENCDLEHVWTTLQGSLEITTAAIASRGGREKVYVPISNGAKVTGNLGGVVSIHAGAKCNSIESIKNKEQFQQRIKYDITKNWVDLMEIGQLKDIDVHYKIIFPSTGLDKPLIICSDNHNIIHYTCKAPLWLRADPTFRGLLMLLREPRDRIFIGDRPQEIIRVEQNPTKYIRGIKFQRNPGNPNSERWFNGSVPFNTGLVAVIGNKGSGKSALTDTLGLLGSTKNSDSFSFLSKNRFRHPIGGLAAHFSATIEWESGEKVTKCLADAIKPEEVERLKYLPQDHVEKICNEIVEVGEEGFEQELKSVIFSHVPEPQRLGLQTLDELVRFQTGEKQKRIDSLLKQLREISRTRAILEVRSDPAVKRELLEKIKRRKIELEVHDRGKPIEIQDPSVANSSISPEEVILLGELSRAENQKATLDKQILDASGVLRTKERRLAVAKRLIEKLSNFEKDFAAFKISLNEDAEELELTPNDIVSFSVNFVDIELIRDESKDAITNTMEQLDGDEPLGLKKQLVNIIARIEELRNNLDAPSRAYQIYLKDLTAWREKRTEIEGTENDPESLKGLQETLTEHKQLPTKIEKLKDQQISLALQIHEEKIAQAGVYRDLYGAVQDFIDSHELAKNKLKLEFRVELVNEGFSGRLLELLHLNRRGSFMGTDEGRKKSDQFVEITKWEEPTSVANFLIKIDEALHMDLREKPPSVTQLKDQVIKGKTPEDVFNLLYGMEYIRPKYLLRWEGKDLSMLSAGERGTLLLVFYLLVDKGDMPLIIDQPEGNLDNHTIAKVLVDCIKAARRMRQVFIVTHNPNLAVVCDADQVVHASMDKANGNAIAYTTGALENPAMIKYVTDVLEGTRWAFDVRGAKYEVGNHT